MWFGFNLRLIAMWVSSGSKRTLVDIQCWKESLIVSPNWNMTPWSSCFNSGSSVSSISWDNAIWCCFWSFYPAIIQEKAHFLNLFRKIFFKTNVNWMCLGLLPSLVRFSAPRKDSVTLCSVPHRLDSGFSLEAFYNHGLRTQKFPVVSSSCVKHPVKFSHLKVTHAETVICNCVFKVLIPHTLVCCCGPTQQVGLLCGPTSAQLNIENCSTRQSCCHCWNIYSYFAQTSESENVRQRPLKPDFYSLPRGSRTAEP